MCGNWVKWEPTKSPDGLAQSTVVEAHAAMPAREKIGSRMIAVVVGKKIMENRDEAKYQS